MLNKVHIFLIPINYFKASIRHTYIVEYFLVRCLNCTTLFLLQTIYHLMNCDLSRAISNLYGFQWIVSINLIKPLHDTIRSRTFSSSWGDTCKILDTTFTWAKWSLSKTLHSPPSTSPLAVYIATSSFNLDNEWKSVFLKTGTNHG